MKYCQECGAEMFDDALICPNCGTYQTILKKSEDQGDEPFFNEPTISGAPSFEVGDGHNSYNYDNNSNSNDDYDSESASTVQQNNYRYGYSTGPGSEYGQSEQNYQNSSYHSAAYTYDGNYGADSRFNAPGAGSTYPVQKYSFWKYFFLGLITCGIYNIYYMYKWTEDTNRLSQGVYKPSMNYVLVFLLSIVTCGIYYYVWVYQQGERLKIVGEANGITIRESGVHHLLLTLLLSGVGGMVSQYIFFNNTNRLSGVYNGTTTRDQANAKTSHVAAIVIGIIAAILFLSAFVGSMTYVLTQARLYDYDGPYYDLDDFEWDELDENLSGYSDVATLGDAFLEIQDAMKIKDANGDPALAVRFYWENNGDNAESAMWKFDITAEQDGHSLTTTWPVKGDPDVDMNAYSQKVEPGDSLEFQVLFKLVDDDDDVHVVVRELLSSSSDKAACTFTIDD